MNPKQFLIIGGIALLALGVIGFIEGDRRLLGDTLWFDNGENVAHTVLGIVALLAAFVLTPSLQRGLVAVVGVVAIVFGVLGFAVAGSSAELNLGVANLENPADNVLHLAVGAWALAVSLVRGRAGRPVMPRRSQA